MECRELYWAAEPPLFMIVWPLLFMIASSFITNIRASSSTLAWIKKTTCLPSWCNKSGIMVSAILIFEALEHVAKNHFFIMERLLGNYSFFLVSPWWVTWFPSKLVTLREMIATRWFLEGSSYHSYSYLPLSPLLPLLFPHLLGFWAHWPCYHAVCILGHRLQDSGQTGVTGTFPTQCHLDGEVLSV